MSSTQAIEKMSRSTALPLNRDEQGQIRFRVWQRAVSWTMQRFVAAIQAQALFFKLMYALERK